MASRACEKAVVLKFLTKPVKTKAVVRNFALLTKEKPAKLVTLGLKGLELYVESLFDIELLSLGPEASGRSVCFLV